MEIERLLQAAIDRDWTELAVEEHMSPTRLTQMTLSAIDDPTVIEAFPVQCRILVTRRDQARKGRSWGM